MNAQNVLLHILCWKTCCTVSAGRNTGISPWGRCFHFVLQALPVPLNPMEISSKGAEYLMWGCPCCLSHGGGSSLARKPFYWLFLINQVFHIKKAEKGRKLLLFNHWTLFSWWFGLLDRWLNADFSIFIGCSNNIKLLFFLHNARLIFRVNETGLH